MTVPEDRPRRSRASRSQATASGYRATRRTSRAAKQARKAQRAVRRREAVDDAFRNVLDFLFLGVKVTVGLVGAVLALGLTLIVLAWSINGVVRFVEKRMAVPPGTQQARLERAKQDLLVIGVQDNRAQGLLAVRLEPKSRKVSGIAIPEGAFVEVPGQGFERIGDSYSAGADVSEAAVSNFLSMPFEYHVIVDWKTYQSAVSQQRLGDIIDAAESTDLEPEDAQRFRSAFRSADPKDVALVPLPVKPINVGDQTYFEPEREEVAQLLETWWGVKLGKDQSARRVIIYNGSGHPGIAGLAAQELIKQGFRVVETRNADHFKYKKTKIMLYHGDQADAERVKEVLGAGTVYRQESDEDVTDLIVIIGKDYSPPDKES